LRSALSAAIRNFNDVATDEKGISKPLDLMGDSKTMEDLLQKLGQSFGHEKIFLEDEGNRKIQELGMYKQGKPAMFDVQIQPASNPSPFVAN